MVFELRCEFVVSRRIDWVDDEFARHVDDVIERLHQAKGVVAVDVAADLDSGRLSILMTYSDVAEDDFEHAGSLLLAVAIRSCGGGHQGLLPFAEEASFKPETNQWSGLRVPTWEVRKRTAARATS
ncbi:MAG TPA: hypothetical protein VLA29_01605 [Acidimicrobiia bacterium]|nr:hypothetical protein [Acidimicrobiia bacterium]